MDLTLPARAPLARLPTPLERLERTGKAEGLDLWIKRDDLTGLELSGNKVRKLEFFAAEALARGAEVLVTCGAVTSNHARATAFVAARLGLRSHLLLRGQDRDPPDGNLLLDRLVGAATTFIPQEEWKHRDRLMEGIAAGYASRGRRAYAIPEGGSNALGSLGYAVAVEELFAQERERGVRVRSIVHPIGSAGTTAGIALGVAACGRDDVDVVGVSVCDDAAYFDVRIRAILDDAVARGFASEAVRRRARWRVADGWKGTGYAQTTPEEMADHAALARREGVVVDPVYTGKAFRGLLGEARAGRLRRDGATVFVHTGGVFGWFAFANEVRSLPPIA